MRFSLYTLRASALRSIAAASVVVVVGGGLLAGCQKKAADTPANGTTGTIGVAADNNNNLASNKEHTRKFYDEVMNKHNLAYVDSLCAPSFTDHNPDPMQKPGLDGLKAGMAEWFKAMPDAKADIQDMVAEGDLVSVHGTMSGTMKGDMMGMKATNKSFKADFFDLIKIKDGKATDRWGTIDQMAMMNQLGLMPGAPPAAPAAPKK